MAAPGQLADHKSMFFVQGVEGGQPIRKDIRQLQKTQGVACRGSVDDNMSVGAALENLGQVEERHHLVHAGQAESQEFIYIALAEEGPALEDFGQNSPIALLEIFKRRRGIKLAGIESGRAISRYEAGAVSDGLSKAIGKRMRRVSGNQVDSIIPSCAVQERDAGGACGSSLADAAFSDEESDLLLKRPGGMGLALSRCCF